MTIHPYLNFPGTTEEAFTFYQSVFGGKFLMLQRFGETPQCDQITEAERNKIMHISLPLTEGCILMGTDAIESYGHKLVIGTNSYICISPDSREHAEKLFKGLSEGGAIEMELQDMFWGAYYGSFTDKFGIKWMINYQNQP